MNQFLSPSSSYSRMSGGEYIAQQPTPHRAMINIRLRIARNLSRYPFPSALVRRFTNSDVADKIWQKVTDFLINDDIFRKSGDGFYKFYLPELKKRERIFLVERRIISPDMIKCEIPCGVVFTKDEKFVALINEEDHLRISVNDNTCPLNYEKSEALHNLITRMDTELKFARDENYGYLTSCPSNLGGAIRLSALFHLGGLALSKDRLTREIETIEKSGFYVRGYYGEKSRYYGDVFQISTIQSPGGVNKEVLSRIYDFFLEIEKKELDARSEILKEKRSQDIIWRSWGVLNTARLISFAEASSALSMVMLGVDIGILNISIKKYNIAKLMTEVQPAHIEMISGSKRTLNVHERDAFRADYIRKTIGAQ